MILRECVKNQMISMLYVVCVCVCALCVITNCNFNFPNNFFRVGYNAGKTNNSQIKLCVMKQYPLLYHKIKWKTLNTFRSFHLFVYPQDLSAFLEI